MRYIKIFAFVLKLNACFTKLIKFPHPGYLNSEALSVAIRLTTLKARHNYLSVEVANTDKLFNGEIALYGFTGKITLRWVAAIKRVEKGPRFGCVPLIMNNLFLFFSLI